MSNEIDWNIETGHGGLPEANVIGALYVTAMHTTPLTPCPPLFYFASLASFGARPPSWWRA